MKRFLAIVVMLLSLTPLGAVAQERVGDAALGGLSGALILGPVGAVAGLVVGYAAGPDISRSWGLKRSGSRYQDQGAKRPTAAPSGNASKQGAAQSASSAPPKPASTTKRAWNSPPVMGFE
jgi:outer membrane lipoprotein SlyB